MWRWFTASCFQITIVSLLNTVVVCEWDPNEIYSRSEYQLFLFLCCYIFNFLSSTLPVSEGEKEIFTKSVFHLPAPSYCNIKKCSPYSSYVPVNIQVFLVSSSFTLQALIHHSHYYSTVVFSRLFNFSYDVASCRVLLVPWGFFCCYSMLKMVMDIL